MAQSEMKVRGILLANGHQIIAQVRRNSKGFLTLQNPALTVPLEPTPEDISSGTVRYGLTSYIPPYWDQDFLQLMENWTLFEPGKINEQMTANYLRKHVDPEPESLILTPENPGKIITP